MSITSLFLRVRALLFARSGAIHSLREKTFEKVSKVKYNGQKVGRLLSVSRNGRKNPPDALAISSRFLKYILPQMIFWIAAAESPVSLK